MENYQLAKIYDRAGDLTKRWYVEYKYRHPETKKFKDFTTWLSTKLLTKEARYKAAFILKKEINEKLKSGYNPFDAPERKLLLVDAINAMVAIKKQTCRTKSHTSYKSMTGKFIVWLRESNLHKLYPDEFTEAHAYDFLDQLLTKKLLSNCTYNCYLMCLKTIFNDMRKRKYFKVSVWLDIKRLPVNEPELVLYTQAERDTIKQKLPELHYELYCVSLLIYNCFLRPVEITRLQIKDFDLLNKNILIQGNKSKNRKRFFVAMPDSLVNALLKLNFENYKPDWFAFTNNHKLTPGPKPIASTRISEVWREITKDGLKVNKGIYDLKHNGNGAAIEAGIDLRQVQLQNRHHSLEQTQIYAAKFNNKPNEGFRVKMPEF